MHVQVLAKLLMQAGIFNNTREAYRGATRSCGVPPTLLTSDYISKQSYIIKLSTVNSLVSGHPLESEKVSVSRAVRLREFPLADS